MVAYRGCLLFIFLLCFLSTLIAGEMRCKLYCFYTPQFESLYKEYFLPSLKDDFEVVARQCEQECPSGEFATPGWEKTMYRKLEILRDAVLEHLDGKVFIYSDIDIIFLRPILDTVLKLLGNNDCIVQQGWPSTSLCAGFMIIRGNEKTKNWIDQALALMEQGICPNDQRALRKALEDIPKKELSLNFLPSLQFPNGRRVLKDKSLSLYTNDAEIAIDDSILLFHANCCKGLENKMHFLSRVKELYERKFP
jgi:Nucleotide-diphospho-sugar transferase